MEEHLQLLKDHPAMQKIYTFVSESIAEAEKSAKTAKKESSDQK
jgi:hypothetical protein